jgi:hypothetical protein
MYFHAIRAPASSWIYDSVRIRFLSRSRRGFNAWLAVLLKGLFTPVLAKTPRASTSWTAQKPSTRKTRAEK